MLTVTMVSAASRVKLSIVYARSVREPVRNFVVTNEMNAPAQYEEQSVGAAWEYSFRQVCISY
jgi:hypothetical protein